MRGASTFAFVLLVAACAPKEPPPPVAWQPGIAYPTPTDAVYRGLLDRRGLIHAHNVHSHDACDNHPRTMPDGSDVPDGYDGPTVMNAACLADFRGDLCATGLDYVFLSDHHAMFDTTAYPDDAGIAANAGNPQFLEGDNAMLYARSKGDELVVRNGRPVANRVHCPGGRTTLVIPGHEGDNLMPVGIEERGDAATWNDVYGVDTNPANYPATKDGLVRAIDAHHADGAVVLVAHTEGVTSDELAELPVDGFEMYNLHANSLFTDHGLEAVLTLIGNLLPGGDLSPVPTNPDTAFLAIFNEDPRYLSTWAKVASTGAHRVTTMGSDCHQNAIPEIMSDGMRGDRYQRVIRWFTNHLLVTPNADGSWDDENLKDALVAGRLYGAFEVLGYPQGFDFHATAAGHVTEMGGEVALDAHPVLTVRRPTVEHLDPKATPPAITVRILRADNDEWTEVAKGPGDLAYTPTVAGAYRAEVREVPNHLRAALGPVADDYLSHDYVWIYANVIQVR